MGKFLPGNLKIATTEVVMMSIVMAQVSAILTLMQLPTAMVSALDLSTSSCGAAAKAPANITVYNYLAIQGPGSTTGYNTVQCGAPLTGQPTEFGRTFCFEMPLLLGQDLSSQLLGVVQGTFVFTSLSASASTSALFVTETFTLNTSSTPQGTFSATGLEHVGQVTSKPIIGGTDAFAFLSGVAITTPLSQGVDSNGNFVSWFKYVFTFRSTSCT
ncbi:hypothetical protein L7F22_000984 [Adiantum nelumboides]|nr:hypothetical protein [Adiantum nelumboides]